jgi:hypothetical protein
MAALRKNNSCLLLICSIVQVSLDVCTLLHSTDYSGPPILLLNSVWVILVKLKRFYENEANDNFELYMETDNPILRYWVWAVVESNQRLNLVFVASPLRYIKRSLDDWTD